MIAERSVRRILDANGNMTTDQTGQSLTYDAWNRLVEVSTTPTATTYQYDATGRRLKANGDNLFYSAQWQVSAGEGRKGT